MKLIIVNILLVLSFWGCHKNTVVPYEDISSKYAAIDSGYTWIYDVDSVYYYGNITQKPDTFTFQVRNTVVSKFLTGSGELSYLISSEKRADSASKWSFVRNYSETRSLQEAKRTVGEKTMVILALPIVLEKTWNGNQYNNNEEIDFFYERIHSPFITGIANYDSTSTIYWDDDVNQIKSFFIRETYASNIGLIHSYEEQIDDSDRTAGSKGFSKLMKLFSFEK